jgi:hypothetical protein
MTEEFQAPEDSAEPTTTEMAVKSGMLREKPEIDASRSALVKKWQGKIQEAKAHWKDDFDRMKEDQGFVTGAQWEGVEDDDKYTANIIQRHINQRVAALYAKNPKVIVRRRKTMDFKVWDGSVDQLTGIQQAMEMAMQAGAPMPPQTLSLIEDVSQGVSRKQMLQKVSDTLSILYDYTLNQQVPPFKTQMKALVRRVCTTGVGFVKIGFQRILERTPEDVERINGLTEQISMIERLTADKVDDKLEDGNPELEQLRLQLQDYQSREQQLVREGLVFDFPSSTSIIVDPACRHLRTFIGARWIAEEYVLTVDDIKEIYGVDLSTSGSATSYDTSTKNGIPGLREKLESVTNGGSKRDRKVDGVKVWVVWDKSAGQYCVIAEGYEDFIVEPQQPTIQLERFWPIFPLIFNEAENENSIYPRSDVHLLKPIQKEYNRSREGLRQHRIANRPATAVAAGQLDEEDVEKLKNRPANAVITLNALPPNGNVNNLLQPIQHAAIDAALYDTSALFEDLLRVVGQSDSSIGSATSGVTATGDSIAEQNRTVALASNVDDLDDMMIELSRSAGQILLMEMSNETVMKIVGPGAVWPSLSNQEIADELLLEVEAGSSGRPNKAAEVANIERITPLLLQIPGVRPDWLVKQLITRLDDRIDPTDAIASGLPSIIAQNVMSKLMGGAQGGPPQEGTESQGGADNEEAPPQGPPPSGPPSSLPQMAGGMPMQ